jgi:hypothetical protein
MAQVKGNNGTSGINPVEAYGVWGDSQAGGFGVIGTSTGGSPPFFPGGGVKGQSESGPGLMGISTSSQGVSGSSTSSIGVNGVSATGIGVMGTSTSNWGVGGTSNTGAGVVGQSTSNNGVAGTSTSGNGVFGESHSNQSAGVFGRNKAGGMAGFFDGNVTVAGALTATVDIVLGADCAEEFDVAATEEIEPGTVMVLDQHGTLQLSKKP